MYFWETIAGLILVVTGLLLSFNWVVIRWQRIILFIICIICAVFIAYRGYRHSVKEEHNENVGATSGDIQSPIHGMFYPTLRIGRSESFFTSDYFLTFTSKDDTLINLKVGEGKLISTFLIRGLDGKTIAAVNNNIWQQFDSEQYEYNDDKNGFEVVKAGTRKVVFQVDLIDSVADVTGFFLNDKGEGIYVFGEPGKPGEMLLVPRPGFIIPPVRRIFKYPRDRFLNDRELY